MKYQVMSDTTVESASTSCIYISATSSDRAYIQEFRIRPTEYVVDLI